tara:strand:- start:128 stop:1048 length:921 start_codon:yes stop_codon:yes gene_type:complete
MVRFFDQKEEVINIELTPYGRQQFASGTLSPAFYAFYDKSIIYDGSYANITETQNQVTNRIANETPRIKPTTRFTSTPGSVFSLASARNRDDFSQDNAWNAPFYRMLGNSDPNSAHNPSWKINVIDISDVGFHPGANYNADNTIPQMSATLNINYESLSIPDSEETILTLIGSDKFVIDVQELNTVFKGNGNFDIEVYVSGTDGLHKSLGFINDKSNKANILSDQLDPYTLADRIQGTEDQIGNAFPTLNDSYVEFFLDISVDNEIIGVSLPTNSTLYSKTIDRNPIDPCELTDASGFDLNGANDG